MTQMFLMWDLKKKRHYILFNVFDFHLIQIQSLKSVSHIWIGFKNKKTTYLTVLFLISRSFIALVVRIGLGLRLGLRLGLGLGLGDWDFQGADVVVVAAVLLTVDC